MPHVHGQPHLVRGDVESEDGEDEDPDLLEQASSDDDDEHIGGSWSQDGAESEAEPEMIARFERDLQQMLEQHQQQEDQEQQERQQASSEASSESSPEASPETIERIQHGVQQMREQLQREKQQEQERQQRLQSKPDICKCNKCDAKACVPCDRPWHENESCEEYKLRIKDKIEEEDATLAAIQKVTKPCPSCSKNILKTGGCKHMYCKSWREPTDVENEPDANVIFCRYPVPDRVLLGLFASDQSGWSVLRVQ
jgi:hypothetical protein